MKKTLLLAGVLTAGALVFAEEKKAPVTSGFNISLNGVFSGGYAGTTNPDNDSFILTNLLLGVSGSQKGMFEVGFDVAVGGLAMPTVWNGALSVPQSFNFNTYAVDNSAFGIVWGYLSLKPSQMISLDVGLLPTNVGYEVANTYSNPNITLGTTWFAQPVIYPAVRATLEAGPFSLYAEYNQEFGGDNFAVGSLGEIAGISYAVSYYDYKDNKNLVDIVGSMSLGIIDLGINFDYQWLDTAPSGADTSAYGVALYAIPNFGNISLPVRVEYFSEGTTGIYTGASSPAKSGYSFTITPTLKPTSNSFIRAEAAYLGTQEKVLNGKNSKTTLAVEAGITF